MIITGSFLKTVYVKHLEANQKADRIDIGKSKGRQNRYAIRIFEYKTGGSAL